MDTRRLQGVKRAKRPAKPIVRWSAMLSIEEIRPRLGRYGKYAVLYTNGNINICCSEEEANKLCLFEPYEMKGLVKVVHGGQYLRLDKAELFDSASFKLVPKVT